MRRVQERRVYYVRRQSLQILFGGTIFQYNVRMEIVNLRAVYVQLGHCWN